MPLGSLLAQIGLLHLPDNFFELHFFRAFLVSFSCGPARSLNVQGDAVTDVAVLYSFPRWLSFHFHSLGTSYFNFSFCLRSLETVTLSL